MSRALIAQAAKTVYAHLGDIVRTAIYTAVAAGTYSPATGDVTPGSTTSFAVPVFLWQYRRDEIDGIVVLQTDRRGACRQAALAVVPTVRDTVTLSGETWQIITLQQDAAQALWIFQLRR